jgi:hypothetical protein
MILLHAILSQKRVLFLGNQLAAGEVAQFVLAACSLVSPHLRGILDRTFPYTNLMDVDRMLDTQVPITVIHPLIKCSL